MAIPKIVGAQRDFSAGELDVTMKRADENPLMKAGCRQMVNWRILNSHIPQNRPGRSALFIETGRTDEVLMSPGNTFFLVFGNGYLRVYNAAGAQVFSSAVKGDGTTAIPWTGTTAKSVVWTVALFSIYITYADGFPNNVPQVLTWDGVSQTSIWTLNTFAETVSLGGQKRTPFYRISPQNVTMQPSATTGNNITLTFSSPILVAGMVGTRMTYCGRQVIITSITSATVARAIVAEPLPPSQTLTVAGSVGTINLSDVLIGSVSGAKGIVTGAGANTQSLTVNGSAANFTLGQTITQAGNAAAGTVITIIPGSSTQSSLVVLVTSGTFTAGATFTPGPFTIISVTPIASGIVVQLLPSTPAGGIATFVSADKAVGPFGSAQLSSTSQGNPQPVSVWADEVMNTFRGYPQSVAFDQNRLIFSNISSVPSAIAWSAIGLQTDLFVDAEVPIISPDNAIFELAPGKSQVFFIMPGPESGEFVFCDNRVYYIPITVQNPLIPGSVAFNILSSDGAANVQPRAVEEIIFYVSAGGLRVKAVIAPGAYYRPFNTQDVSENHTHLFTNVIALAAPNADGTFPERYVYALNADNSVVVGKYAVKDGQIAGVVGWAPWSGAATVGWISALAADVIMWAAYAPNGIAAVNVIEKLDDTKYLDAAMLVNSVPTALTPPAGKGPLWWLAGGSVSLMDTGARMMGTYLINANGNIIPQFNAGENLLSSGLVAGQPWTATLEPFVPDASPGQSQHQRMFKRRVSRMAVYVSNSTGFVMARLFSGPLTRTSPALGTVMNNRRFPAWNQDDDPTQPPPLREEVQRTRPLGRAYDPRVAVIKDTPGPLVVHELGLEASI